MQLEEIKAAKAALEQDVRDALDKFTKATTLPVERATASLDYSYTLGRSPYYHVEIEVKI